MTLIDETFSDEKIESKSSEPQFPGQRVVTDGNSIITRVAYKVNGGISIYTITPSSPFGEESARMAAEIGRAHV